MFTVSAAPPPPDPSLQRQKLFKTRRQCANISLSGWLRDIFILSGCFSLALLNPSNVAQAHCCPSHLVLCFFLQSDKETDQEDANVTLLMLKIINCPNKNVLSGDSGSKYMLCMPSCSAYALKSRLHDSKNHGDVAISTESLQIPGNQYKPTSGNKLWMEMKCMYSSCLSTGDVIYSLIEICFPSRLVEFVTWHVWYCVLSSTVMDYSKAIKYINWDDMVWRNISSHILKFLKLD